MGHHITALIGSRRALSRLTQQFGPPATTELVGDLVVMPLGSLRLDLLTEGPAPIYNGFTHLSSEVEKGIIAGVGSESAIYVETKYFGGLGEQGAAFFTDGAVAWRRATSTQDAEPHPAKTPISSGLAELSIVSILNKDEFDVAGLFRFRSLEKLGLLEWADED